MAKFTTYRVTALPTSNIDEKGLYFLRSGNKVTIYVRYNNNWELVGGTGDVEKVNGLTGEVEIDLDFTSGQLKVISSGTGTPLTTTSINLDTRYERLSNKVQDLNNPNSTTYPSTQAIADLDLDDFKNETNDPFVRESEVGSFDGITTDDTADIKLLGDGTVGDALKAELADMPNAEDIFGRLADGWQPIIRKGENTEFRWIEIVDADGFALLTYVYEYYDDNDDTWKPSRKILVGTDYSGGLSGVSKDYVVASGNYAAYGSKGNHIQAFGNYAAEGSEGNRIHAFGQSAARSSKGSDIHAFGNNAAHSSKGNHIQAFGNFAARNSKGSYTNAFGQSAAHSSEGNNINAFGNNAARDSEGNFINAFGNNAARDSKGNHINVLGVGSYNEGQDFNHVNIFGPNLQPTKSNQNIIGGEEFLMPGSTPQTILDAGDKSLVTVETVKSMWDEMSEISITPSVIALMHGEAEEDIYPVMPNLQWDITIQSIVLVSRDTVTGSNLEARILINDTPQQGADLIIPANSRTSNEINLIDWDLGQNIDLEVTQIGSTDAGSNLALYIFYSLRS